MRKGDICEGYVEKIDFPNKGYVWVDEDGMKTRVIVKNAVPGQKVRFAVNKKRKDKCEGRLLEVLENSPLEKKCYEEGKVCKYFGKCGGCVYQSMEYSEQLKMKESQVKSILDEAVKGDFEFEGIIGSPVNESYRNKMEFTFGDEVKGGELALGLHKRNSTYDIVTVNGCKIVDNDFSRILDCVCSYFKEKNLPYFHKMTHEGYLRHLLVRKAVKTGQILVDIVTTTQLDFDMSEITEKLRNLQLDGTLVGLLHTYNDSIADVVKGYTNTNLLKSDPQKYIKLYFSVFKKSPKQFIEAFALNTLGFWNPEKNYYDSRMVHPYLEFYMLEAKKHNPDYIEIQRHSFLPHYEKILEKLVAQNYFSKIPIISSFLKLGTYFTLFITVLIFILYKKSYKYLVPLSYVFGLYITLFLSPVALFRYGFPILLITPVYFNIFFQKKEEQQQ